MRLGGGCVGGGSGDGSGLLPLHCRLMGGRGGVVRADTGSEGVMKKNGHDKRQEGLQTHEN